MKVVVCCCHRGEIIVAALYEGEPPIRLCIGRRIPLLPTGKVIVPTEKINCVSRYWFVMVITRVCFLSFVQARLLLPEIDVN